MAKLPCPEERTIDTLVASQPHVKLAATLIEAERDDMAVEILKRLFHPSSDLHHAMCVITKNFTAQYSYLDGQFPDLLNCMTILENIVRQADTLAILKDNRLHYINCLDHLDKELQSIKQIKEQLLQHCNK